MFLLFLLVDTMDTWDQQKLEEVVQKKHGDSEKKNTTEIVCITYLLYIKKSVFLIHGLTNRKLECHIQ